MANQFLSPRPLVRMDYCECGPSGHTVVASSYINFQGEFAMKLKTIQNLLLVSGAVFASTVASAASYSFEFLANDRATIARRRKNKAA